MIVGILKETFPNERRVALVPTAIPALTKAGVEVLMEAGAGEAAGFPDAQYAEKGVRIVVRDELFKAAGTLVHVRAPRAEDLPRVRPGHTLIGFFDPLSNPEDAARFAATGATCFSMELIPRITRAQSMDALSSMATVAGYRAVLLAAYHLPRLFPMLMTAAGTVAAARAFVIGAGVAGLQAIATSRRLGAIVQAYDVRPAVKEQIESLGARFVELPIETAAAEDKGGYAKAQDETFYQRQRELMARVVAESDVVITTAAVPGKPSPRLITRDMLPAMAPGSVIVDLAAERGGNCEATRAGEIVVESGVTVLGPLNLPSDAPYHASQMYARNVTNLLLHLIKQGDGTDDEIVRETMLARGGSLTNDRVRGQLPKENGKEA